MAALLIDTGERYYNYTDYAGVSVSMADRAFYNYAIQPIFPPKFQYHSDTDKNFNNLKNLVFQFAYRYVYHDGRRSVYSPYSGVAYDFAGEDVVGEALNSVTTNNKIVLYVTPPVFSNELDKIEFVCRKPALIEGAVEWGLWENIGSLKADELSQQGLKEFAFYNDVVTVIADQDAVAKSYDYLPIKADAQEALLNNRVAYGGITEGYDTLIPDVTLTEEFLEIDTLAYGDPEGPYDVEDLRIDKFDLMDSGLDSVYYKVINIDSLPDPGSAVVVSINSKVVTHLVDGGDTMATIATSLIAKLIVAGFYSVDKDAPEITDYGTTWPNDAVFVYNGLISNGNNWNYPVVTLLTAQIYSSPDTFFSKNGGFKSGALHPFCLYYYDELGRRSEPVVSDDLNLYLPFITEQTIATAGAIYKYNIDWAISHKPPSWARYWGFGYAGNASISSFVQYSIVSAVVDVDGNFVKIGIKSLQDITTNSEAKYTAIPNTNIPPYEFEKGDRIRFITPKTADPDDDDEIQAPFDEYYDYEIVDYDDDAKEIFIAKFDLGSDPDEIDLGPGSVVEIYTPLKRDANTRYFETGDIHEVLIDGDGEPYHTGDFGSTDQSYGVSPVSATGKLTSGDVYHFLRLFSYEITSNADYYPIESFSASDFYDSHVWGKGKIGAVFGIGQKKLNNIRHSDQLIQDTKINGLSSFQEDNVVAINRKYGNITAMREIGYTLKVLQESNNVSIGVGRTEYDDIAGNSTTVASDKVLGAQRISVSGWGCVNPESVLKVGHKLYWFDALRGCMIRDAGGGAFPISGRFVTPEGSGDYKMEKYFQDKAQLVRDGYYKVLTGWHESSKLLFVYFQHIDDSEYVGYDGGMHLSYENEPYISFNGVAAGDALIAFHEPSNRWVSEIHWYGVDYISSGGTSLVYFIDDKVHVYAHDDADDNTFDGATYSCGTDVYSSEANFADKIFHAISVHSNVKPRIENVVVYTEQVKGGMMISKIFYKLINKIEGVFRSAFLRNGLHNGTVRKGKLFNGDLLRGKVLKSSISFHGDKDGSSIRSGVNIYKVDYECESSDY